MSLLWYRDRDVCKQVDSRDAPYDVELLRRMYDYFSTRGDCCYIEYEGTLVGDVSLQNNVEIAIVVSKAFQNQHIGRRRGESGQIGTCRSKTPPSCAVRKPVLSLESPPLGLSLLHFVSHARIY